MLLNAKLNDEAQKMLWEEAVQTFERVRNSTTTTGITTSLFGVSMEKIPRSLVHSWSSDVLDTSPKG